MNRLRRVVFVSTTEVHHVGELHHPTGTLFSDAEELIEQEENSEPADPEPSAMTKPQKRSPQSGGRKPFPEGLPRKQSLCDLPEAKKTCPHDGAALVKIGERIVEALEVIPAQATVIQHVYPKYCRPNCKQHVSEQPSVPAAIPQASCAVSTLAYVILQKFMSRLLGACA